MDNLEIFDKDGKALHIGSVISRFISEKEKEHKDHNLFIEVIGKKLYIGKFTEFSMDSVETIDLP